MVFDPHKDGKNFIKEQEEIHEEDGNLASDPDSQKLMRSVMEGGENNEIDIGKVLSESMARGLGNFTPELFFKNLVQNYRNAERLYGETLIREVTGYDSDFVRKNLNQPEFQREIKRNIEATEKVLKKNDVLKQGEFSEDAIKLASLVMLAKEIDKLEATDIGPRLQEKGLYGNKSDYKQFNHDRYKQIAVKHTIKTAIRRNHKEITHDDLRSHELQKHGKLNVVYALDVSGSMMGDKLALAKKAGIALSWNTIKEKNNVGLIIFDVEVQTELPPSRDIYPIVETLARTKAGKETNLSVAIIKGIEMLKAKKGKKHILLVTDGMPTKGKKPITDTLEASSIAKSENITVSIVGISMDAEGLKIAEQITEITNGFIYSAATANDLHGIVLQDYYESIKHS